MGEKKYLIAGSIAMGVMVLCIVFLLVQMSILKKQASNGQQQQEITEVEDDETKGLTAEEKDRLERAKTEIARFKEQYDIDIPIDEMVYQLQIRDAYEKMYNKSYDLEDIFIVHNPVGDAAGDEPDDNEEAYMTTEELIDAYVEKYDIDETRFEGMTPEQELEAIKIEYGSLNDETDSAYYKGEGEPEQSDGEEISEEDSTTDGAEKENAQEE